MQLNISTESMLVVQKALREYAFQLFQAAKEMEEPDAKHARTQVDEVVDLIPLFSTES